MSSSLEGVLLIVGYKRPNIVFNLLQAVYKRPNIVLNLLLVAGYKRPEEPPFD